MLKASALLAILLAPEAACLSVKVSRRASFGVLAGVLYDGSDIQTAVASPPQPRDALLTAIDTNAADAAVLQAIDNLLPLDPSAGRAAVSEKLDGQWTLLWSYGASNFSPLLGLPKPIRPASIQLLGEQFAAPLVGQGRVANVLEFPLATRLILSSGVTPVSSVPQNLEILPPFRLDLDLLGGVKKVQVVEAGSDADFRALNARDADAQAAPRNMYAQLYLETTGSVGDLRVSKVVSGDPVIVGSIFVHQRL